MKYSLMLALSITVVVTLACTGCIGGGSNAQTYETDWGKVQIDIPQKISVTGIEGGRSITIMKDGGVSPILAITISEGTSIDPDSLGIMGAKVNTATSDDNHAIYWYLNPMGGFKQYLGYIDHTADKNLLVNFVLTPLYYDTAEGKIITAFEEDDVLSILKSFRFVDFKGQLTQSSEITQDLTYHMTVIGDSIAWGNGLKDEYKYSYIIADWLKEKLMLSKPVDVAVYAHSGATISGESVESIDQSLNSGSPSLMVQARNIKNKGDIDLILVSGGINDVGISNILDANTPRETISSHSESIRDDMSDLLTYLLDETNARIIVTGYYPLITEDSKVGWQDRAIAGALATLSEKTTSQAKNVLITALASPTAANVKAAGYLAEGLANNIDSISHDDANLRANSDAFYAKSSNSLKEAILKADSGRNRVIFIDPRFETTNSYKASNTLLWELTSDFKTNDEQYQTRADLVEKTYALDLNPFDLDLLKQAENKINPIAHPNRDGAAKYAESIESFLDTPKRLDWLQNGPTADSEASITQDSITESPSDLPVPAENSNIASVSEPSSDSDISNLPENSDADTKTAYTKDGINFISEERLEQNIRNGLANLGEYDKVQVPMDTIIAEASTELT